MKKIAFLMPDIFTFGGEQRVVSKVANLLYENGYDVTVICNYMKKIDYSVYKLNSNIKIEDATPKNFLSVFFGKVNNQIRYYNSKYGFLNHFQGLIRYLLFSTFNRKKLINIINENKYDCVIGVAHNFSLFLALYKNKIHSKIIGWQHNNFEAYFYTKGSRFYNEKGIFQKYCVNFDHYIVLMDSDKEKLKKEFNLECTRIYNPNSFSYVEEKSKLNNKLFLAYGRLEYVKGYDLLLDSFYQYKKMGGTWKLQIIGDGSEKENLINMIKNLRLENDVELIGFTNEIEKYIQNATVFLFPSRWEGFGLVLTESMQYGLPSICYDLPPFQEITDGYNSCYLISKFDTNKFAEKMFSLSTDEKQIFYMSKEAIKNVEKFSEDKIITEWIKILNIRDDKNER